MTSCVVSLFFLAFLCSSINAVDPTGLKLRITKRAQNVLRDAGLEFLQTLVNRPYDFTPLDAGKIKCTIRRLTLTRLDPDQVDLSFQQGSGLQFEIRNLNFAGDFEREVKLCLRREFNVDAGNMAFGGTGVSATIGVKLSRNRQRRLSVEISKCVFRADVILTRSTGWIGRLVDLFRPVLRHFFNTQFCPAVQRYAVPQVNSMLENISMATTLNENHSINIDYSLSGDVTVAPTFLDVPFKGLVFRQGETVNAGSIRRGADPIIRESDWMAYVGVSEFLFNSAIMSVYSAGLMEHTQNVNGGAAGILRTLQLFRQPSRMNNPLSAELEVTEAPSISISRKDGMTVNARARVRVFAVPARREKEQLLSVSARCTVQMTVAIKGNNLALPSSNIDCGIITKNGIRDVMVKPLNRLLSTKLGDFLHDCFDKGRQIPLPEGMGFTQRQIDYQDGFIVVGGDLTFTPDARNMIVRDFGR